MTAAPLLTLMVLRRALDPPPGMGINGGQDAVLTEGCLRNTRWKGANLNNAFLSRTLLRCADLSQTNLTGANLRQAFGFETMFHGANLDGSVLLQGRYAR